MATAVRGSRRAQRPEEVARHVFLQPIAAPEVLGYFALASALIIYGSWFAGAWGTAKDTGSFFEFIFFFGGLGQFGAAMWSYRARNAVSAAFHGSWAAFWLGLATIYFLVLLGTITVPARGAPWGALGQWFMYMSVITWTTAFAVLSRGPGGFIAHGVLAAGAAAAAGSLMAGSASWQGVAGWLFVAAGGCAFYMGAALMLDNVVGFVVLPLLTWRGGNRPGSRPLDPIEYEHGDPGVKEGQ